MNTKILFFFMMIAILMSGCSTTKKSDPNLQNPVQLSKLAAQSKKQEIINPQFVVLQGNFNVLLSDKIDQPMQLKDKESVNDIKVTQNNNSLSIVNVRKSSFSDPIYVAINAKDLEAIQFIGKGMVQSRLQKVQPIDLEITTDSSIVFEDLFDSRYLQLSGSGEIIFKKFKSDYLVMNVDGAIKVNIEGKINLQYLNLSDRSKVNLHWVDSSFTRVIAKDNSYVELAGVAKILEIVLQDRAKFNGEYLRINKAFANTSANTRADINAKDVRNISALGESKVYNHRNTTIKNDHISIDSSVLEVSH